MSIIATNNSQPRELIPAGNYLARCYQMIEIGTVRELIMGTEKILHKVRLGWELPTELKVFKEENGEQPWVISKEFTLSMHEKSNLRIALKSWRGKDFTEEQAKSFDITILLGVACMINIIHKPGKADPSKTYEEISGITGVPRGIVVPAQINPTIELSYDKWSDEIFNSLPDFIQDKIRSSLEYAAMRQPEQVQFKQEPAQEFYAVELEDIDSLPF